MRGARAAEVHVFDAPTDDRWHYPFNLTAGFRPVASVFGAGGVDAFNDRDGLIYLAWDTSALIQPGLAPSSYDIAAMTVTLTNDVFPPFIPEWQVDLTVDDVSTYLPGGFDSDPGRPIELFGIAFESPAEEAAWTETTPYMGASQTVNRPRDPFPFAFQEGTEAKLHVEDSVRGVHNEDLAVPLCANAPGPCPFTPQPWAIGEPIGYTPGAQSQPFDVVFEIDLSVSSHAVRRHFQEQLSRGRVLVAITSLKPTSQQNPPNEYPNFFMKEGVPLNPLAKAPKLEVALFAEATGDIDADGEVSDADWELLVECPAGPGIAPLPGAPVTVLDCLCHMDFDGDGDVDLADLAEFQVLFSERM